MSDHVWFQEHIAAFIAGGLDAQEAERLEAHARDCHECATLLAEIRQFDGGLSALFANARPAIEMEDRAVARLRTGTLERRMLSPRATKWAGAIAAVLLLGVIGAVVGSLASDKKLRMEEIQNASRSVSGKTPVEAKLMAVGGLDSDAKGEAPEIEPSIQKPSDDKVTVGEGKASGRNSSLWHHGNYYGYVPPNNADGTYTGDVNGVVRTPPPGAWALFSRSPTAPRFDPTSSRPAPAGVPTPTGPGRPAGDLGPAPGPQSQQPAPTPKSADPAPNPEPTRRIVLRSGDIEFEIESFDAATATVTKLVSGIKGAFVGTINSDKLPNGKVKGAITVRVPPEHLDGFVLDLRRDLGKGGELKGVKLTSQDVTKQYTDLESRLKAARTMEQRLLQIIKEGKGEIKQLLEAEKELGVWRTKIEEFEGEIRYYANLAALSTLTIVLTEKEIKAAAAITERERVQAGVEVEDVDKAYQQLLAAVAEVKGRIAKSELKQLSAGQFNATFQFEVAAESGGPIRDRLRMLGRVARLEIDRTVQTEGGTLPSDAKTKRGDTLFLVQLYNLANVAPRETAVLQVAAPDVPAAYQALRDAVAKTPGRVLVAQLNEQDRQNVSAQFDFEAKRSDEGAVRAALEAAGEALSRQVTRAAESDTVTDTKILYRVTLLAADRLRPRETQTLSVEVADVDGAATLFAAQVTEAKGRQVDAKFDRDTHGRSTAHFVFEVPLPAASGLVERFKSAGTVRVAKTVRDPQAHAGRYATARLDVTLTNVEAIVPEGTGLWPKVRQGLTISASVLLTSVTWVVFGLCVVLPWAVVGLGGYRVVRRLNRPAPPPAPLPPPSAPAVPPPAAG